LSFFAFQRVESIDKERKEIELERQQASDYERKERQRVRKQVGLMFGSDARPSSHAPRPGEGFENHQVG